MLYLFIFLSSLIFTIFFTPYLIFYLFRVKVIDLPGNRKIHATPVPRMGGIIIYALVNLSLIVFYNNLNEIRFLLLGSFVIALCGILDDVINLRYRTKMIFQSAAAVLLLLHFLPLFNDIYIFTVLIPSPFSYLILFLFIIGAINSINLLDGLDGLVSSFSLIIGLVGLVFAIILDNHLLFIICAALTGSIIGFLKFNAFPAKIFLGDTGSLVLGYFVVTISLIVSQFMYPGNNNMSLTFPVILLALPVTDTLKVIFLRLKKRQNPFLPDNHHIHHILLNSNISHKSSVFIIGFFSACYAFISVFYYKYSHSNGILLFILVTMLLLFLQYYLVRVSNINKIKAGLGSVLVVPRYFRKVFRVIFFPATFIIVIVYILSVFPPEHILSIEFLAQMLLICILFLAASLINNKRYKVINDIYVLINLIFFIFLSKISVSPVENMSFGFSSFPVVYICIGLLSVMLVIFLFLKEYMSPGSENFLTGLDLIIIVMVSTSFVLSYILLPTKYLGVSNILLQAFILYLWYKAVIYIKFKYARNFFYASFALPLFLILFMIIF